MRPALTARFYRARPFLLGLACASPLLVLGGVWWAVDAFVLTPPVPGDNAPMEVCVRFVVDVKGLPRLDQRRREQFLEQHVRRLARDAALREQLARALRRLTAEDQAALRAHLFDAFKPRVMADIRRFDALQGDARRGYLDERIVAYNRLGRLLQQVRIDKSAFGRTLPDSARLTRLVLTKASDQERQLGRAYLVALAKRIEQILADPRLKQEFEARIAAP